MAQVSNGNNQLVHPSPTGLNEMRFLARSVGILALLTGLIYLRVIGVESISALRSGQWNQEIVILFGFLAAATLSILCAWRWEAAGGLISALCAIAIAILAYNAFPEHKLFSAFAYSSPFLITGGLFFACRQRSKQVA